MFNLHNSSTAAQRPHTFVSVVSVCVIARFVLFSDAVNYAKLTVRRDDDWGGLLRRIDLFLKCVIPLSLFWYWISNASLPFSQKHQSSHRTLFRNSRPSAFVRRFRFTCLESSLLCALKGVFSSIRNDERSLHRLPNLSVLCSDGGLDMSRLISFHFHGQVNRHGKFTAALFVCVVWVDWRKVTSLLVTQCRLDFQLWSFWIDRIWKRFVSPCSRFAGFVVSKMDALASVVIVLAVVWEELIAGVDVASCNRQDLSSFRLAIPLSPLVLVSLLIYVYFCFLSLWCMLWCARCCLIVNTTIGWLYLYFLQITNKTKRANKRTTPFWLAHVKKTNWYATQSKRVILRSTVFMTEI